MIALEQLTQRVAEGLTSSETLRDWATANCGAAPRVNVLYDPGTDKMPSQDLAYTPMLVVAPALESGAGMDSGLSLDIDVWCRVNDPTAETSAGAAGTPLRAYRAAARLLGLARQAMTAIEDDLDGTNAIVDRHTIDRFDLAGQWPIVQCAVRLHFEIPALLGATLDLEVES